MARCYVNAGCKVGITGRRMELLDSFKKEFSDSISERFIVSLCFDVTGSENGVNLDSLISKLGGLDLLIYNSGFGDPSESLDWEIDKKTVDINVNGFVEIVNRSFRFFVSQGHGHIAATSSVASNRGNSFAPAYSASKAFMSCYLEGLYLKARRMKLPVYVTDIQPGFVRTKEIRVKGQFWIVPVAKAARQMVYAIEHKRFRVYISRRWWIIAKLMRIVPRFIYGKFG